ncbi:hypothetical protein O9993_00405 [Vibrio lentus]|nr:hypothetical protein [Vibrio lentus]
MVLMLLTTVMNVYVSFKNSGWGFGVCHSEFIITDSGPVLVEINYRSIGDGREFLLDNLSGGNWFNTILNLHLGHKLDPTFRIDGKAPMCTMQWPNKAV